MTHTHFSGRQAALGALFASLALGFCAQMSALKSEAKALRMQADASAIQSSTAVSMETLHSAAARRRQYRNARRLRPGMQRLHNQR